LQCDAVCCRMFQCAAVCCSVLQCVAVTCLTWLMHVLQCDAVCCSMFQCVAVCCSVLQCVAVCCSDMSNVAHACVSHVTWLIHVCDLRHAHTNVPVKHLCGAT